MGYTMPSFAVARDDINNVAVFCTQSVPRPESSFDVPIAEARCC